MSSGCNYKQRGIRVSPTSYQKLRGVTGKIRGMLELNEDYISMSSFLEHTLMEIGIDFHVDDPRNPILTSDEIACAFPDRDYIVLRAEAYEGICEEIPMYRFTLAHEFGHMVLHNSEVQGFPRAISRESNHKPFRDSEWQADAFAAELMMPAERARGLSAEEIARRFGVSLQAARIRESVLKRN